MSIFKLGLSKKTKLEVAAGSGVLVAIVTWLVLDVIFHGPITRLLTDQDRIISLVESWGAWGPLLFILIQILQTVVAPIPGHITGIVGGYFFGWWGILWTMIGAGIGLWLVLWLSRRFGRRFVEKVIRPKYLQQFDYLTHEKGGLIFFLLFLIPGLPDDVIAYLAGLTNIPIKVLLLLGVTGRLPAVVANNLLGSSFGEGNLELLIALLVFCSLIGLVVIIKRQALFDRLRRRSKDKEVPVKPSSQF